MKMIQYNLKMPASLIKKLEARKQRTGVPIAEQIRRAVEKDLKR